MVGGGDPRAASGASATASERHLPILFGLMSWHLGRGGPRQRRARDCAREPGAAPLKTRGRLSARVMMKGTKTPPLAQQVRARVFLGRVHVPGRVHAHKARWGRDSSKRWACSYSCTWARSIMAYQRRLPSSLRRSRRTSSQGVLEATTRRLRCFWLRLYP